MAQNHDIRLVESRPDILARIHRELPTEAIYEGKATDPQILEQAGIERADVVAAVTNNDADNLTLCFMARSRYKVGRTIARVNNPRSAWLFDQKFHVDVALNAAEILSGLIEEEMSLGDMMTLLKLRQGQVELVEEKIAETSIVNGKAVKDIEWPPQCTLAAVIRKGDVIAPNGNTVLQAYDEVLAVLRTSERAALASILGRS